MSVTLSTPWRTRRDEEGGWKAVWGRTERGGGLPHSNWEVGSCDEGAGREAGDSAGDARGLGQVAGSRQLQLQPKSKGH